MSELGVEVIHAHSPAAKGRIERLFGTFQDRLIKEMRLARVASLTGANRFLEHYLPGYNQRFRVERLSRRICSVGCPGNWIWMGCCALKPHAA